MRLYFLGYGAPLWTSVEEEAANPGGDAENLKDWGLFEMRHFSLEEWADFARDIVKGEQKTSMQTHLESGCNPCARVLGTWARVHEAATREKTYQPPESAVRTVKGLGAIHIPAKTSLARLLFDSSSNPIAAGVRSASTVARQLLYGVGAYRIDLRMEPQMDTDKVSLVGQILNSADPAKHAAAIPVVLLKGRKILAESHTNGFGEFHLQCDLEGSLQLRLTLPHGSEVRIPLVEPAKAAAPQNLEALESHRVTGISSRKRKSTRKRV